MFAETLRAYRPSLGRVQSSSLPDLRAAPTDRGQSWAGNAPIVACFGDRCLRGQLRRVVRGLNTEPVFTLAFVLADVAAAMPDLVEVLRVYTSGTAEDPVLSSLVFTGYVESLGWAGAEATLAASPMVGLKTQRMGGLSVFGITPGELFWTFARIGGFSVDQIKIGEAWPPPSEDFFVVAPIDGVELKFAEHVGDVTFTPDEGLRRQWQAGAGPQQVTGTEYLEEFRGANLAAVTTVRAHMVLEAERIGFSRIEAAASRLALVSRHSIPVGLSGKPRSFGRDRLQEQVRPRRVVGVLAKTSQRQWIRGLDTSQDKVVVALDALSGMADALKGPLDAASSEAIKAWRRAVQASEPASAVVALAEAVEFYAAGVVVEPLFAGDEITLAQESLRDMATWTVEQRGRLDEVLSRVNDAPFFVRLLAVVRSDGLTMTKGERRLLRTMRDHRNDLLHGRERRDPSPDELSAAIGLVGRLLIHRVARRGAA